MPLFEVETKLADICESGADLIVHQTNRQTLKAQGVAKILFEKFPEADCYADESNKKQELGSILIRGRVVNLFGQDRPGQPRYQVNEENRQKREKWFKAGLDELEKQLDMYHSGSRASPKFEPPSRGGNDVDNDNGKVNPVETGAGKKKGKFKKEDGNKKNTTNVSDGGSMFQECQLSRPVTTIAFPKRIGCGLAGGNWPTYEDFIVNFAKSVQKYGVTCTIYSLPMKCPGCYDPNDPTLFDEDEGMRLKGSVWMCHSCVSLGRKPRNLDNGSYSHNGEFYGDNKAKGYFLRSHAYSHENFNTQPPPLILTPNYMTGDLPSKKKICLKPNKNYTSTVTGIKKKTEIILKKKSSSSRTRVHNKR